MIARMLILLTTYNKLFLSEDCFCFSFWAVVYSRAEGRLGLHIRILSGRCHTGSIKYAMNVFNILPILAFIIVYMTRCHFVDKQLILSQERADMITKQNNFCCDSFKLGLFCYN